MSRKRGEGRGRREEEKGGKGRGGRGGKEEGAVFSGSFYNGQLKVCKSEVYEARESRREDLPSVKEESNPETVDLVRLIEHPEWQQTTDVIQTVNLQRTNRTSFS